MLSMMKPISPTYINVKGRLLDLATPQVMGILNVTPDSFYSGSRILFFLSSATNSQTGRLMYKRLS